MVVTVEFNIGAALVRSLEEAYQYGWRVGADVKFDFNGTHFTVHRDRLFIAIEEWLSGLKRDL